VKFFTHEINSRTDDRLFELLDIHGLNGYGFFWVILEELYGSEETGFQIEATNIWMKRLARSLNLTDDRTIIRYFDTLADLGLIDKQLWHERIIYSQGVMQRADAYMKKKAKEAEKKRNQRIQAKLSGACPEGVPKESLGTEAMSQNVPISDPDPDPDPNSDPNSFFLRAQEKKISAPCKFEISLPEEKKEVLALEDNPEDQDPIPPVAPPPPYSQATSDRIMQMRQAEKDKWTQPAFDCKKLSKDDDFVDFIQKVYLPTVPDNRGKKIEITQAQTWIVKGQRDPARRDLVEIQIRAFEKHKQAQQQRSQQQPAPQPIELVASPPPAHLRERFRAS
jgi:hypothetical protein